MRAKVAAAVNSPNVTFQIDDGQKFFVQSVMVLKALEKDVQVMTEHLAKHEFALRGRKLLITGGTGFFGRWLLLAIDGLNRKLELNLQTTSISRSPEAFLTREPEFNSLSGIRFERGDARKLSQLKTDFDFIIHGATAASASLNETSPLEMYDVIVEGTKQVLELARRSKTKRVLNMSSGAVYGFSPTIKSALSEDDPRGPDPLHPSAAYAEGKRVSELLCRILSKEDETCVTIARCFAFVGPYLPLDSHFAIGNFLKSALVHKKISIQSDGSPVRSWMYPTDLVIWLFEILLRGEHIRPYNVGSPNAVTLAESARLIRSISPKPVEIEVLNRSTVGTSFAHYVPNVSRAESELGLTIQVPLEEALRKTLTAIDGTF